MQAVALDLKLLKSATYERKRLLDEWQEFREPKIRVGTYRANDAHSVANIFACRKVEAERLKFSGAI
eukprot:2220660-Lingulodinium_polyedra.AAC.1